MLILKHILSLNEVLKRKTSTCYISTFSFSTRSLTDPFCSLFFFTNNQYTSFQATHVHCMVRGLHQFFSTFSGIPRITSLRYDSQFRILTCTSTGGPATTVTWRREGVVINLNATYRQTKNLVDPVNGTYQTVLTIDSSVDLSHIEGLYICRVENTRGRSSKALIVGELIQRSMYVWCCC